MKTTTKMIRLSHETHAQLEELRDLWSKLDTEANGRRIEYTLQSTAESAIFETLTRVQAAAEPRK